MRNSKQPDTYRMSCNGDPRAPNSYVGSQGTACWRRRMTLKAANPQTWHSSIIAIQGDGHWRQFAEDNPVIPSPFPTDSPPSPPERHHVPGKHGQTITTFVGRYMSHSRPNARPTATNCRPEGCGLCRGVTAKFCSGHNRQLGITTSAVASLGEAALFHGRCKHRLAYSLRSQVEYRSKAPVLNIS